MQTVLTCVSHFYVHILIKLIEAAQIKKNETIKMHKNPSHVHHEPFTLIPSVL